MTLQIASVLKPSVRFVLACAVCVTGASSTAYTHGQFAGGALTPDCFTQAAVTMAPYDDNIQRNRYRMTHDRVYHNGAAIGSILLYGPVHSWEAFEEGFGFAVMYIDPDGTATGAAVKAQLRHVGPGGIRIIATLDSNRHARALTTAQVMSTPVEWAQVSGDTGYLVVRVYIERSNTALTPAAFGYTLCSAVFLRPTYLVNAPNGSRTGVATTNQ